MSLLKNDFQKYRLYFFDFVMIGLGIVGVVGGFLVSLVFPQVSWIGVIILIGYAWLLYISYQLNWSRYRQNVNRVLGLALIGFVYFFINDFIKFIDELKIVIQYDYFLDVSHLLDTIKMSTELFPICLLFFMGLPISYLIVSLICQKTRSLLKILILIVLYAFPAFIMHPFYRVTSYCFILFICYEFIFGYTLQHQKQQFVLKTVILVGVSMLLFVSSLFLENNPLFDESASYVMRNLSHLFNGQNMTGTSMIIDGALPTNNVQLSNRLALRVTSTKPVSTYLRGYSLAYYKQNEWHALKEDYPNMSSTNIATQWMEMHIGGSFIEMTIEPTTRTTYQFVPYFSKMNGDEVNDSYYPKSNDSLHVLPVYPKFSDYILRQSYRMHDFDDYTNFVYSEYLDVPEDLKTQLVDYIEDKSQLSMNAMIESLETKDIIDLVKKYLFEDTKYDLNTGILPVGEDFVEYFLFQNRKGSCTHYATTAALMLRCFDIPTRFVKGYVIKESDFHDNKAEISSSRSHAWIEVYFEDKGWIPIEVTPSSNSDESDLIGVANMLDELQNNTTLPSSTQPSEPSSESQTPSQSQPSNHQGENSQQETAIVEKDGILKKFVQEYAKYIIGLITILTVVIAYRVITRLWFILKLKHKKTNQQAILYYQRMQRILHFGGHIDETLEELIYKAKFSQHTLTNEEILKIQEGYANFVEKVYQSLSWYKKIVYKYIYGYK